MSVCLSVYTCTVDTMTFSYCIKYITFALESQPAHVFIPGRRALGSLIVLLYKTHGHPLTSQLALYLAISYHLSDQKTEAEAPHLPGTCSHSPKMVNPTLGLLFILSLLLLPLFDGHWLCRRCVCSPPAFRYRPGVGLILALIGRFDAASTACFSRSHA